MNFKKRTENLEVVLKGGFDQEVDAELTAWFKSNPDYMPFAQPESNKVEIPPHLGKAFAQRIDYLLKKNNLPHGGSSLLEILDQIYL